MKTLKFREPLESFLKKEKIKTKFVKNITNLNNNPEIIISSINEELLKSSAGIISGAFIFINTPEGINYWNDINSKWLKYKREYQWDK